MGDLLSQAQQRGLRPRWSGTRCRIGRREATTCLREGTRPALDSGGVEGGAGGGLAMRSPLELEGEGERRGIEREMRGNEGEMAPGGGVWTRGRDGDRAGLARVRRDWWGRLGLGPRETGPAWWGGEWPEAWLGLSLTLMKNKKQNREKKERKRG